MIEENVDLSDHANDGNGNLGEEEDEKKDIIPKDPTPESQLSQWYFFIFYFIFIFSFFIFILFSNFL